MNENFKIEVEGDKMYLVRGSQRQEIQDRPITLNGQQFNLTEVINQLKSSAGETSNQAGPGEGTGGGGEAPPQQNKTQSGRDNANTSNGPTRPETSNPYSKSQ
jgi:hypothetical protein